MSDQVLESGVSAVVTRCESRGQLYDEQAEILIADIHSVTIKVRYQCNRLFIYPLLIRQTVYKLTALSY